MGGGKFSYCLLNAGDGLHVLHVDTLKAERAIHEVDVAIGEAGKHEAAARVNYTRGGTAILFDLRCRAYGNNVAAASSQRLRPGLARIHGVEARVDHQRIRGGKRLGGGARVQRCEHEYKNLDSEV